MTVKLIYENYPDIKTSLSVGPRVSADIRRRIHELESRFRPSPADRAELGKLKRMLELLATLPGGPQ